MQNEKRINGLETQVRTLKRIVCLVCCVFGVFVFTNCSATSKSTDKETLVQDKVEEGKPDHPDQPDKPDHPDHPDHPDKPDQPDKPDHPDHPDHPGN